MLIFCHFVSVKVYLYFFHIISFFDLIFCLCSHSIVLAFFAIAVFTFRRFFVKFVDLFFKITYGTVQVLLSIYFLYLFEEEFFSKHSSLMKKTLMKHSRRYYICYIDVHGVSYAKQLRSKNCLENIR